MHFGAQSRGLRTPCERFAPWVTPGPRITRFRLVADLGRMGLDTHRVSNKVSKITSRHLVPLDRAFPAHALMHGSPPRSGRRRCARLIDGNLVSGLSITEAILEAVPVWRVVQCPGEAGRAVSARDEPSGYPARGAALRRTAAAGVQSGPAQPRAGVLMSQTAVCDTRAPTSRRSFDGAPNLPRRDA